MRGFVVREADLPLEAWADPVRGEVSFRTVLGGDAGRSRGLVHGIAYLDPGKVEGAHHHPATETIHVLAGSGIARLDEVEHVLAAGDTVYVPAGVVHEWRAGADGLRFLYSFAADSFDSIEYVFKAGTPPDPVGSAA